MNGRIRFIGVANKTGIGTHVRNVFSQLAKIPATADALELVNRENISEINASIARSTHQDFNLFFIEEGDLPCRYKGFNIIWYVFDLTSIPDAEISRLITNYHEIWVPSEWARQILLQHGVPFLKIRVMPEGVDPDIYYPEPVPQKPKDSRFRIIQIGKYETRKGYADSVTAINQAFGGRKDIEYLVKCDWINGSEITQMHPNAVPLLKTTQIPVVTASGVVNDFEMAKLYRSADVFIFPSRGEGWGLPLIEALACGVPCLATCYSGQSEFLNRIEGLYLPMNYTLKEMDCPETKQRLPRDDGNWGLWACPDQQDFAAKLRACREQNLLWRARALEASEIIRREFSWRTCANHVFSVLKTLESGPA